MNWHFLRLSSRSTGNPVVRKSSGTTAIYKSGRGRVNRGNVTYVWDTIIKHRYTGNFVDSLTLTNVHAN